VSEAHLGLRDFRWVNSALPGKLGLMDIDGVLTQASTGRVLVLELKPKGAPISVGARLTFGLLVRAGLELGRDYDVWYLWDQGKGRIKLGEAGEQGEPLNIRELTERRVVNLVVRWWEKGLTT